MLGTLQILYTPWNNYDFRVFNVSFTPLIGKTDAMLSCQAAAKFIQGFSPFEQNI